MRRLDFKEASELIKAVDAELESLLGRRMGSGAESLPARLVLFF